MQMLELCGQVLEICVEMQRLHVSMLTLCAQIKFGTDAGIICPDTRIASIDAGIMCTFMLELYVKMLELCVQMLELCV